MSRIELAIQLTLGVICALLGPTGALQACSRDRDCSQPNTYCYDTGICANCTNCKTFNRNSVLKCTKHPNQCGDCFQGMKADVNIDGTLSVCRPIITTNPPIISTDQGGSNTTLILGVAFGIIALLIAGVLGWCFLKRCTSCTCSSSWQIIVNSFGSMCPNCLMNTRDCPPPYTEKNPTAPPFEEPIPPAPNLPIQQTVYRHIENDPSQRANPCVNPNWVRGGNLSTNPNNHHEPTESDRLMDLSIIHDEDTQPSTWSPSAQSTGPTSFQNSLVELETLNISQPQETSSGGTDTYSNTSRTSSTISINMPHNTSGNSSRSNDIGQQININVTNVSFNNNNVNLSSCERNVPTSSMH